MCRQLESAEMLKRKALSAAAWSGIDLLTRQGVQFATTLVLARLLLPADFGLIAMLAVFVAVGGVLADAGFGVALIQKQDVSDEEASSVFWVNFALGAIFTAAIIFCTPLISTFYELDLLRSVIPLMALSVLFGSAGGVHAALLVKRLDFRAQAKAGGVAALVSGVVAIALALRGVGVWALVYQAVLMSALNTAMLWIFHPWRPKLRVRITSLAGLGRFGGYHLASTLMDLLYVRLYALLLGWRFGPSPVGNYRNAEVISQMPLGFLGGLVGRVAFPMFSAAAADPAMVRRGLQLGLRGMMLLNAPLMLLGAALSEPLVNLLLGPGWSGVIPILRVLCIAGLLYPLHLLNLNVLMGLGHARLMFRIELAKKCLGVILLTIGLQFGVIGIAYAYLANSFIGLGFNTYYSGRLMHFGVYLQMREIVPPILAALAPAVTCAFLSEVWGASSVIKFSVLAVLGVVIYASMVALLRINALRDVLALLPARGSENGSS